MLGGVDVTWQSGGNVRIRWNPLALDDFFGNNFAVNSVTNRASHPQVVEGGMRHLRGQIPGDRCIVEDELFAQFGIVLNTLEIRTRHFHEIKLVVFIGKQLRLPSDDGSDDLLQRYPVLLEIGGILFQSKLLVMVPALEREHAIAHNIFGLSPLVPVFLYTGAMRRRRSSIGHQDREIATWPFERELQSQIVLRLYSQLGQVFDFPIVDF